MMMYLLLRMDDDDTLHPINRDHAVVGLYKSEEAALRSAYLTEGEVVGIHRSREWVQKTVKFPHHLTGEMCVSTYAIVPMVVRNG